MRKSFLVLAALFAVSAMCNASTIIYNYSLGPAPSLNTFFNVDTFRSEWGTLHSVTLDWTVDYDPDGTSITNGLVPQNLRVILRDDAFLGSYMAFDQFASPANGITVFVFSSNLYSSLNSYQASETKVYIGGTVSQSATTTLADSADLAPFISSGAAIYPIPIQALDDFQVSPGVGSAGVVVALSSSQTSTLQVTYEYAEVPEPVTSALFGAAFLGLGLLRRRRR
jgi:hypothetical protein